MTVMYSTENVQSQMSLDLHMIELELYIGQIIKVYGYEREKTLHRTQYG